MTAFILPTLAVATTTILLRSAVSHLAARAELRAALEDQGLLPVRLRALVAATLGPVEAVLGLALAASLVSGRAPALVGGLVAAVGIGFVAVILTLARTRPGAPCGCVGRPAGEEHAVGALEVGRATLVLVGGLASVAGAAAELHALAATEVATTWSAGVAVAVAVEVAVMARPPEPSADPVRGAPT